MPGPIVFISHFRIKEGRADDLRALASTIERQLLADKPRTLAWLVYLDEEGSRATFVHTFGDAEAMDLHFVGSDERTAAAYELIEPTGFEIYGAPSDDVLGSMRRASEDGPPLTVVPEHAAGFLRAPEH